jgi:hypothetical protein
MVAVVRLLGGEKKDLQIFLPIEFKGKSRVYQLNFKGKKRRQKTRS